MLTAVTGLSAQPRPIVRRVDPALMDRSQLTRVWNILSPDLPIPPPGFRDYTAGLRRIDRLLAQRGLALVDHVPYTALGRHVTIFPHMLHAVPVDTAPALDAVPPRTAVRWRDELVMHLQVSHNPKRPGTPSHERFACREPVQTVQQYRLALLRAGLNTRHARGDVIYDWERGYIRVFEPDGTEVLPTHPFKWQKGVALPRGKNALG